ncbi:(2Fe-2S)-binding protein [Streptomyces sp. NPDC001717]|uniref:(2Fe-2S)-binding protein n=1 Tax=Streptomyces sp. NPDC001717 TaxID=3364604 RepID=UPI003676B219
MSPTDPDEDATGTATTAGTPTRTRIVLRVNGVEHSLEPDHRTTLLDALRDHLDLTGAKKGCDQGQCGACTVLLDGRRVCACLLLAVAQDGAAITTVEGLSDTATGAALQRAFVARDAFQCGFCTPGQLCSAVGALAEAAADPAGPVTLTEAETRERLSGNLCRCGAYPAIVRAVRDVAVRDAVQDVCVQDVGVQDVAARDAAR